MLCEIFNPPKSKKTLLISKHHKKYA